MRGWKDPKNHQSALGAPPLFQFSLQQQQQQQSDTGTMELGPTLTEFYAPATSSARKQQLEQGLHAFRTLPNAHLSSLEIILAIVRETLSYRISPPLTAVHCNTDVAAAAVAATLPGSLLVTCWERSPNVALTPTCCMP